jgi:hypothetical protein
LIKFYNNQNNLIITNGETISHEKEKIWFLLTNIKNIKENEVIYLNDIKITEIDQNNMNHLLYGIDVYTEIPIEWLRTKINNINNVFVTALKEFQINFSSNESLNIEKTIILNLLSCLFIKNKIIHVNKCLNLLTLKQKQWIETYLFPEIKKQNFLFFSN